MGSPAARKAHESSLWTQANVTNGAVTPVKATRSGLLLVSVKENTSRSLRIEPLPREALAFRGKLPPGKRAWVHARAHSNQTWHEGD